MSHDLFIGSLFHKRFKPKSHQFTYPAFFFGFDLDSLESLSKTTRFFSYNAFNLFSLYDNDYFKDTSQSIAEKIRSFLTNRGYKMPITTIKLVTSARCLGICFNPANFFYCYNQDKLICVITEVNNTYGERHPYILPVNETPSSFITSTQTKSFDVSPFFNIDGHYDFKLSPYQSDIYLSIQYKKQNELHLHACLKGSGKPLSSQLLIFTFLKFPWVGVSTFLSILFEAFRLKFLKKLPIFKRTSLMHKDSYKISKPSFMQKVAKNIILNQFESFTIGRIDIELPSGLAKSYGDPASQLSAKLRIKNYHFFTLVLFRQEIGLGEAYMYDYWESDTVEDVLELLVNNLNAIKKTQPKVYKWLHIILKFQHYLNRNTQKKSKKNIHKHYDLNNNFFKTFLDESMMYSCAFYPSPDSSLYEAQQEKIRQVITKADVKSDHHVLEIGSGWGAMAIELAQTVGCKVTTVTISQEQHDYVSKKIKDLKLTDKITLLFKDYRVLKGQYDRIISIEMIEAVGHKFLNTYFNKLNELLKPAGRIVIQAITINNSSYNQYRKGNDWIRKYIFPGGHLPSVGYIETLIESLPLSLIQRDDISKHYVKTLEDWKQAFLSKLDRVTELGFDTLFIRKWLYYFSYSQAGFSSGYIQDYHLVFSKK